MIINAPISLGELVDKITILRIKLLKIKDPIKLINIKNEEALLVKKLEGLNITGIEVFLTELEEVNLSLWIIEDEIRDKENQKEFDDIFIELAREVYKTNDDRFNIKQRINKKYNSGISEEKSYLDYK